jgi:hypothetical protein
MRGYPNATGWSIAPRLNTRHAAAGAIFQRPQLAPSEEYETQTLYSFAQALPETERAIYRGRTLMLARCPSRTTDRPSSARPSPLRYGLTGG